jgi:hypothetical protein
MTEQEHLVEYPLQDSNRIVRTLSGESPRDLAERIVKARIETLPSEEAEKLESRLKTVKLEPEKYLKTLRETIKQEASRYHTSWWQLIDFSPYVGIAYAQNKGNETLFLTLADHLAQLEAEERNKQRIVSHPSQQETIRATDRNSQPGCFVTLGVVISLTLLGLLEKVKRN